MTDDVRATVVFTGFNGNYIRAQIWLDAERRPKPPSSDDPAVYSLEKLLYDAAMVFEQHAASEAKD